MKEDLESVRCVGKRTVADLIEVSPNTITDWVKAGRFPPPFRAMPGAPDRWLLEDVKAWIAKRQRSRAKQAPRGLFKRVPDDRADRLDQPQPSPEPVPAKKAEAILRAKLAFVNAERKMLGLEPATFDDIEQAAALTRDGGEWPRAKQTCSP